jgi:hypothetical protein
MIAIHALPSCPLLISFVCDFVACVCPHLQNLLVFQFSVFFQRRLRVFRNSPWFSPLQFSLFSILRCFEQHLLWFYRFSVVFKSPLFSAAHFLFLASPPFFKSPVFRNSLLFSILRCFQPHLLVLRRNELMGYDKPPECAEPEYRVMRTRSLRVAQSIVTNILRTGITIGGVGYTPLTSVRRWRHASAHRWHMQNTCHSHNHTRAKCHHTGT